MLPQAAPWMHPDADIKEAREIPGPGQYSLSKHSDFGLAPQMQQLQVRRTERPLQMPLRVSQLEPQQTSKKLLMSKSHERLAKITMKGMRSMAAKDSRHKSPTQFDLWPKSTFGVGRTPVDGWGRGVEPRFPGPGAYDAAPEGTFEAKRRATENISSFAEAAHLGATERRLENLRQLQIKHRKGILDIAEKGIYESESRPSTVDRLQRRKEHFKGLLESKSKCFDDMFRPRTSYVLPCQAIASRRARRSPKPSRALQAPSYELPPTRPVSRQVIFSGDNPSGSSFADEPDGAYPALLSNYEFATASLPASEAYGFGLLDVNPSLANSNPIAFGAGKLGLQHGSGAAPTDDEDDDYDDEFDDDKSAYADGDNGTSGDARNDNPRRRRGHRGARPRRSRKTTQDEYVSPVPTRDMSLARFPPSRNQEDEFIPSDVEHDSDDDNAYLEEGLASPVPAFRRRHPRPRSVPAPPSWKTFNTPRTNTKQK